MLRSSFFLFILIFSFSLYAKEKTAQERLSILEKKFLTQSRFISSDLNQKINAIQDENRKLRGTLEILIQKYQDLNQVNQRILQQQSSLFERLEVLDSYDSKANSVYDRALGAVTKQKNYELSKKLFLDYINYYPQGSKIGEASYWLGSIYYNEDNYDFSFLYLSKSLDHPDSNPKVAQTLLKLALIEKKRGNLESSQKYARQLIQEYPNTPSSEKGLMLLRK